MTTTYRAAYWVSADRQSSVRLTTEDQQQLSDDDLRAAAEREAAAVELKMEGGIIEVGEWTD